MKLEIINNDAAIKITSSLFNTTAGKTYSFTINDGSVNTINNSDIVNNNYYTFSVTLSEGISSVVLKEVINNVTTVDRGCIFKNNETGCKVAKQLASKWNQELATTYFLLVTAADKCVDCEDLKVLYNSMDYGDCEFC